jgi:hypothetical protein
VGGLPYDSLTANACAVLLCCSAAVLRRDLPLIPTRAAAAARAAHQQQQQQQWLASPKSLFDPRNATLLQLLDPLQHFPAALFDGSNAGAALAAAGSAVAAAAAAAAGAQLLDSLALCGMKTQVDLQVLSGSPLWCCINVLVLLLLQLSVCACIILLWQSCR